MKFVEFIANLNRKTAILSLIALFFDAASIFLRLINTQDNPILERRANTSIGLAWVFLMTGWILGYWEDIKAIVVNMFPF